MSQNKNNGSETGTDYELEQAVRMACEPFDYVASVNVDHPNPSGDLPKGLHIVVYTGEAESYEEHIQAFSPKDRIVVQSESRRQRRLSVNAIATFDGPQTWDTYESTPVYVADDVRGAEAVPLVEGIEQLRKKLTDPNYKVTPSV